MPVAPRLVWVEHSTASAHVSESSGTRSRSTTSSDSGNTSNSSASTPRFGRSLLTSSVRNSVWLASVLGNVGVHELDYVSSNRSLKNGWKVDLLGSGGAISAVHRNYRSCSSHVRFNLKIHNKSFVSEILFKKLHDVGSG